MNILATDGIDKLAAQKLIEMGHTVVEEYFEPEQLKEKVKEFDILIVRSATKVDKAIIDAAKNGQKLKLIIRGGVGMDNIDVEYAIANGIMVNNTPAASSNAVAELAIGHMLSAARFIGEGSASTKQGQWNKSSYKGVELFGKTLGLIGFGRIGQRVGTLAKAFGMNVLAYDTFTSDAGREIATYVTLDELFASSDFISVHLPGQIDGKPLIREENINKMKDSVIIINTSRGSLVDENDLLNALNSGKVRGAGLDVYDCEPCPNKALVTHKNVSCTPHIGASSKEAQEKIALELVEIIKATE